MKRPIFPTSITQFSTESLIKKHSTKSKAIYWLLIFVVILFGIAIFYIKVDVNIHSSGLITSTEKASPISSPSFGYIKTILIKENDFVKTGDTLIIIDTVDIGKNAKSIHDKLLFYIEQNKDLEYLCSLSKWDILDTKKVFNPLFKLELQKFKSDLKYQKLEIEILKKNYIRNKELHEKKVIPNAEFEQVNYKYENAQLQYNKIFDNQMALWQSQYNQNRIVIFNLNENLNTLQIEFHKHFILSPIEGYIQELSGLKAKGMIYPNQDICVISPTSDLIVETYVTTSDIGLIKLKQKVKFRVDAYNYNQWGMLSGEVSEIANDISVSENGIPSFKIRCKLNATTLSYQGKTVEIKKGMTLNANFFLARRTIAQLFYDNITDWLDPNEIKNIE